MIIATRHLLLRGKHRDIDIPVRIHAPEKAEVDWICRFEIGWPEGKAERWGAGPVREVHPYWPVLGGTRISDTEFRAKVREIRGI